MTAIQLARKFATHIADQDGVQVFPEAAYGPRIRNAKEAREHGWMPGALATVTYEGGTDMAIATLSGEWVTDQFYMEAYSSYMVGVYRR